VALAVVRYIDQPELWSDTEALSREVWPEYNRHGDVVNRHWDRLFELFPEYQFALYEVEAREVAAEGHCVPCPWDGTPEGLGEGIDAMIVAAVAMHERGEAPAAACAMAAEIRPRFQGRGLAARVLDAMADLGRRHALGHLVAPVRPSLKHRYPLAPIERYVTWTNDDGEPFDPWIRVHVRRGGTIVRPAPRSMRITATVGEWEAWTGMRFPDDGEYTFPGGLAPLTVDRTGDIGAYWEPNVWIAHAIADS
jgi:GNAT superfamily N-acetyltransferase